MFKNGTVVKWISRAELNFEEKILKMISILSFEFKQIWIDKLKSRKNVETNSEN